MTNEDYLLGILNDQNLPAASLSQLRKLRGEIEAVLRAKYGSGLRIYYAGSYGKNTMIKDAYDLDIVIYFPSTEKASLKDIYNSVLQTLRAAKYIVHPKTVALRLPYQGGFHFDIVPGKAQDSTFYYATLYKNGENSTMQTSIKKHIDTVQSVKNTIRLVKVWRLRKGIDWETFALEQTVVRALAGLGKDNYEKNLINVFKFIRDKILTVSLVDPANSANNIDIPLNTRLILQQAATNAIDAQYWTEVIY